MKKRLVALTRIGKLQARMHDLGRWRLSAIERQQAELSDDLRAIFEALATGELAYGAQAKLSVRHIRALQTRLDFAGARVRRCAPRGARPRHPLASWPTRRSRPPPSATATHKERKELAELVERAILRRIASST